ncbi:P-loop containing nucleoside triphosphate hydrolase protein, partial [Neocallimastix californiae]
MNLEPNPYIEDDHESQTEAAAVRVCDVRKSFNGSKNGRKEILKGINFNAYSNEIFAILGPNGAGKTTLINIMIGVLSTTKGMVYYHNKPLLGNELEISKLFGEIGIAEKKSNFPNELSGGQKRKLGIALAFLGSPKYVFLDEPTTGLDPYSRKAIWEFLSRKKEGCTIFVTTHYMDEADLLADRKMIILDGEIYCLGSSLFLKNVFNMSYTIDIQ